MTTEAIKPGQSGEIQVEVTEELTTNRMGKPGADVSVSKNCNTHCILLSFAALGTACCSLKRK